MKIMLIYPPTNRLFKLALKTSPPPLSLAYLAAVARENGHDVKVIDSQVMDYTFDDVEKEIKNYSPDLVGITATTSMIPDAYRVAKIAKNISKDTKVAIGGPHVTFVPEDTLKESENIDYVVRGEGEIIFSNLLKHLEGKMELKDIRGLSYRKNGTIVNNPPEQLIKDVDTIPYPAFDLLPMERYKADNKEYGTIITSRGCPYNCIFCSSSLQFGKRWRGHSVERVIDELKILREKYNKKEIEFMDDTFTLNMKRAIDLTKRIKEESLDISWSATARVNLFNDEIARSMKSAGAHTVYFGIESGVQKTLDFIGKGITLELAKSAVKKATNAGLHTFGSFIIGFPEETVKDVKTTIKFSQKVGVTLAQFTIATPFPGTGLWNYVVEKGLLLTRDWGKYTAITPVIKLKNFTSEEIMKWVARAYISFYLRPTYLLSDIIDREGFIFKRMILYIKDLGIIRQYI